MKKSITLCILMMVLSVGVCSANLTTSAPMSFTGVVDLDFAYYPPDTDNATQDGILVSDDNSDYSLILSSVDPGPTGADIIISWDIRNTVLDTSILNGTMLNFDSWDNNGNNPPSGSSGTVFSSADYATSGAWQGVGEAVGSWLGTFDTTPQWQGTVVITPTAVPVPGAFLLGGIGVACVGWIKRRKSL